MRRFTRLTNAFSKKLDNHIHAIALYFVFYNFCRIHKTLRVSPGDGRWRHRSPLVARGYRCEDRCNGSGPEAARALQEAGQ